MTLSNHLNEFQGGIEQALEKQIENARVNLIWIDYHKEFMEASREKLLGVVNNYSFREKIESYFCENSHIRYKVARRYLANIV